MDTADVSTLHIVHSILAIIFCVITRGNISRIELQSYQVLFHFTMVALLEIRDLACLRDQGSPIFSNLNFVINEGDIVVIQGKSGSG
jgi:ABC-type transport system involved in cytochrome bd biosynthesis fused ATPase/permease subunit